MNPPFYEGKGGGFYRLDFYKEHPQERVCERAVSSDPEGPLLQEKNQEVRFSN